MRIFLAILLVFVSSVTLAGTRDPNTPDAKYLEFGKEFPWVVPISNSINCGKCKERHSQRASAVLIKPNWALTAAHVVNGTEVNVLLVGEKKHLVTKVIPHADFKDDKVGMHDIALCYSPDDFGLAFYVPLYRKNDEIGKDITIAGWGMTGTFVSGANISDNQRRAGQNRIISQYGASLICMASRPRQFPLEFMISPGDSGGGMFIGNELAGINSFLMAEDKKADGTYTDESAFTRVSLYADWVELQIEKHENALQARATMNGELP